MGDFEFRVVISKLRLSKTSLTEGNSFVELNFDNYKTAKTEIIDLEKNREWNKVIRFNYATKHIGHLRAKTCILSVMLQRYLWTNCVGMVKLDLETLAFGPVCHSHNLEDAEGNVLDFDLEMNHCVPMTIVFSALVLSLNEGNYKSLEFKISLHNGEKKSRVAERKTDQQKGAYFLENVDKLVVDSTMKEAWESHILFDISEHQLMTTKPIACVHLPIRQIFPFRRHCESEFTISVYKDDSVIGELNGQFYFENLPMTAQMTSGVCNDEGIQDGVRFAPYFPYPRAVQYPPSKIVQVMNTTEPVAKSEILKTKPEPRQTIVHCKPSNKHASYSDKSHVTTNSPHNPTPAAQSPNHAISSNSNTTAPNVKTSHTTPSIPTQMPNINPPQPLNVQGTSVIPQSPYNQTPQNQPPLQQSPTNPHYGGAPTFPQAQVLMHQIPMPPQPMSASGAPLPPGWQVYIDSRSNAPYYVHSATNQTQWHFPS